MPTDDRTSLESNLFALTVFIERHLTDSLYLARYCRPGRRRHRVLCRCSVVSSELIMSPLVKVFYPEPMAGLRQITGRR
ncbi:hypothetical protein DHU18_03950 [Salmonella enterica]|nr:hypothetical protein [Salmonella enterica]EBO3986743.1 hypothetical protein [Salmonella enterica]